MSKKKVTLWEWLISIIKNIFINNSHYILLSIISIFTTIIVKDILLPYIFHPYRWGSIPWGVNPIILIICKLVLNILFIMGLGTFVGVMETTKSCKKYNIKQSFNYSKWYAITFTMTQIFLYLLPYHKLPLLIPGWWIPYSDHIVTGILCIIPLLITSFVVNGYLNEKICKQKMKTGNITDILPNIEPKEIKFKESVIELEDDEREEAELLNHLNSLLS